MTSTAWIRVQQKIGLFQSEFFFGFDIKFSFFIDILGLNVNFFPTYIFWFEVFFIVKSHTQIFTFLYFFSLVDFQAAPRQSCRTFFLQKASLQFFRKKSKFLRVDQGGALSFIRVKGWVVWWRKNTKQELQVLKFPIEIFWNLEARWSWPQNCANIYRPFQYFRLSWNFV